MVDPALRAAYAACQHLARNHYENFPVASWLVPRRMRPHVAAVYAFARHADDMADEGARGEAERRRDLDAWRQRLVAAATAGVEIPAGPHAYVFVALRHTIATCGIETSLLLDLLSAFEQDVTVRRYATWTAVHDYCRRSANPVGRLVLRIAGVRDDRADHASDDVCTALQLANFWQDLAVDWSRGRLYVPEECYARHGATLESFDPAALTAPWRAALAECRERARDLFWRGREVPSFVDGRLRLELRATWLGGMRILEKLEQQRDAPVHRRPSLGAADTPTLLWRLVTWSSDGPDRAGAAP